MALTGTISSSINYDALFNVELIHLRGAVDGKPFTSPFRRLQRQGRNEKARVWLTNEEVYEAVLASA